MEEKLLTPVQVCVALNVSIQTLRLWDKSGKLQAIRTPGNQRRYRESDIIKFIGIETAVKVKEQSVLLYSRVSSAEQKTKGDLDRQNTRLTEYAAKKNYKVSYVFTEVGSGMNDSRAKLNRAMQLAIEGKITKVIVEHKDRLIRFNFNILKLFFESHGVEVEYIEETLPKSYEAELIEDMLSLMSSFSAKIYGKRSGERRSQKCS
ncbi:IS607 family transposase [Aerosakkonema sp. BLCC-F183]|uniref:IS607 family transposase n=1 Tax=Aerosakkonema sp. BLCC-F183 TaxID=3342834 RepID=UPI0035BAC0B9